MKTQIIDTSSLWQDRFAKKTKGMIAKPLNKIITDSAILPFLKLNTLEGLGDIDLNKSLCIGVANECWMQEEAKIIAKYKVTGTNKDGWITYTPKPDNEVEFFILTEDMIESQGLDSRAKMYIKGEWGQEVDGNKNLQEVEIGDAICRQVNNHSDQWRVAKKVWDNSYEEI